MGSAANQSNKHKKTKSKWLGRSSNSEDGFYLGLFYIGGLIGAFMIGFAFTALILAGIALPGFGLGILAASCVWGIMSIGVVSFFGGLTVIIGTIYNKLNKELKAEDTKKILGSLDDAPAKDTENPAQKDAIKTPDNIIYPSPTANIFSPVIKKAIPITPPKIEQKVKSEGSISLKNPLILNEDENRINLGNIAGNNDIKSTNLTYKETPVMSFS